MTLRILLPALTGALLALTDLPEMRRVGTCGARRCRRDSARCGHDLTGRRGLGPPGPTDGYRPSAPLDAGFAPATAAAASRAAAAGSRGAGSSTTTSLTRSARPAPRTSPATAPAITAGSTRHPAGCMRWPRTAPSP